MDSLVGIGLYSVAEAAALSGIPAVKIRRWLFGYTSNYQKQEINHPGLWQTQVASHNIEGLGFHDLLEIRFVDAFREHGVSLQAIRAAAQHARDFFNSDYPFTCDRFRTDGRTIFAEILEETGDNALVDMVKKQYVFKQVIRPSLYKGIQYDAEGDASHWFPLGNRNKRVVLDPERAFGKPIVTDSGVPTDILYSAYLAEEDINFVSNIYDVPVIDIEAAINFEKGISSGAVFH